MQCSGTSSFLGDKIHFFPSGKLMYLNTHICPTWLFFIDNGRIGRKKSLHAGAAQPMQYVVVLIRRVEAQSRTQC